MGGKATITLGFLLPGGFPTTLLDELQGMLDILDDHVIMGDGGVGVIDRVIGRGLDVMMRVDADDAASTETDLVHARIRDVKDGHLLDRWTVGGRGREGPVEDFAVEGFGADDVRGGDLHPDRRAVC